MFVVSAFETGVHSHIILSCDMRYFNRIKGHYEGVVAFTTHLNEYNDKPPLNSSAYLFYQDLAKEA